MSTASTRGSIPSPDRRTPVRERFSGHGSLVDEVRRLQTRAERQNLALSHATEAIVVLRRGLDAAHAQNRELLLELEKLRAAGHPPASS